MLDRNDAADGDRAGRRRRRGSHPNAVGVPVPAPLPDEPHAGDGPWRALLEAAPDAMLLVDPTRGQIRAANRVAEDLFGFERDELIGKPVEALVPPALRRRHAGLRRVFIAERQSRPMGAGLALTALRKDGTEVPVEISLGVADIDGVSFVIADLRDISERTRMAHALRDSERRFRTMFEDAPIGMTVVDLRPPNRGRWLEVNAAFARTLGYRRDELVGREISHIIHPEDHDAPDVDRVLHGDLQHCTVERRYRRRDGRYIWARSTISAIVEDGEARFAINQFEDITAEREMLEQLERAALHDSLTGLPHRVLLMDRLEHRLAELRRVKGYVALYYVDLDRFKHINDTLGHATGDRILADVARRLQSSLRPADTAARFGGDEFALVVGDLDDRSDLVPITRRLLALLNRPALVDDRIVPVTASVGLVVTDDPDAVPDELLGAADAAMYEAKRRGGAHVEIFDEHLAHAVQEQRTLEGVVRDAIERGGLKLTYQPVIDLDTGLVTAVEALVRIEHAGHGVLSAATFIGLAEDTGLIITIGRWVVNQACAQLAAWQAELENAPTVTVNLSGRELVHPDLAGTIHDAIAENQVDPRHLCLEITESVLTSAAPPTLATLAGLSEQGVRIALDDFGTGYSSLTYLQQFPVDIVKIDQTFTAGLDAERDAAIVDAVVHLARRLDLTVIAEGVETYDQAGRLRDLGCRFAQGHLFAPPLLPDAATRLLRSGTSLTRI